MRIVSSDPAEWIDVKDYGGRPEGDAMWQNRRYGTCFSTDGGETFFDITDPAYVESGERTIIESTPPEPAGPES